MTETSFWLVLTVFGIVSGGVQTPSDLAYCRERQIIEEPAAKRVIHNLEQWNGWAVEASDVDVFCKKYRKGRQPRIGKRLRKT